jgi:hypothetical protein
MAWEERGSHRYYYRSRRVDGRVVKEYVGNGELADSIAALEALGRQKDAALRGKAEAERREQAAREAEIEAYCRRVDEALAETLTALGYHRHDRGQWRRKRPAVIAAVIEREGKEQTMPGTTKTTRAAGEGEREAKVPPPPQQQRGAGGEGIATATAIAVPLSKLPSKELDPQEEGHRREILKRAREGDESLRGTVRTILSEMPADWPDFGEQVRQMLLKSGFGNDVLRREMLLRDSKALQKELEGPSPTVLERLLAERIAVCWLAVCYQEALYYQNLTEFSSKTHQSHQDRMDRANRRYLSAIKALAQVRRLQLPLTLQVALPGATQVAQAAQVNVAEKQINATITKPTASGSGGEIAAPPTAPTE